MTIAIEPVAPMASVWTELIERTPSATFFHSGLWISPETARTLSVRNGGDVVAGLVLPKRPPGEGKQHMIPYSGPLLDGVLLTRCRALSQRVSRALAEWILQWAREAAFCTSPWASPLARWLPLGFRATLLCTRVLDLRHRAGMDATFSRVLAANLRAAERAGLRADLAGSLDRALQLARDNFVRLGGTPWYDEGEVERRLRDALRRSAARVVEVFDDEGYSRAAVVIVWDRRRAYYVLGGLDRGRPHRGALSSALRRAMCFVRDELGLPELDLEGSNVPNIAAYFEHFGGMWQPYYRVKFEGGNVFND